jgi:hypothetical protein
MKIDVAKSIVWLNGNNKSFLKGFQKIICEKEIAL